jgi:hypothetical protein
VNWYRLDVVRDTLRLEYGAVLAPSMIGKPHAEAWKREVGGHVYVAQINYENDELLLPEEQLVVAVLALRIDSPSAFLARVKARGGDWTGPSPVS